MSLLDGSGVSGDALTHGLSKQNESYAPSHVLQLPLVVGEW